MYTHARAHTQTHRHGHRRTDTHARAHECNAHPAPGEGDNSKEPREEHPAPVEPSPTHPSPPYAYPPRLFHPHHAAPALLHCLSVSRREACARPLCPPHRTPHAEGQHGHHQHAPRPHPPGPIQRDSSSSAAFDSGFRPSPVCPRPPPVCPPRPGLGAQAAYYHELPRTRRWKRRQQPLRSCQAWTSTMAATLPSQFRRGRARTASSGPRRRGRPRTGGMPARGIGCPAAARPSTWHTRPRAETTAARRCTCPAWLAGTGHRAAIASSHPPRLPRPAVPSSRRSGCRRTPSKTAPSSPLPRFHSPGRLAHQQGRHCYHCQHRRVRCLVRPRCRCCRRPRRPRRPASPPVLA